MEEARKAAQFLVDAYAQRRPTGDAEPYALIVARALLAMTALTTPPAGEESVTEDIAAFCDACAESSERHLFVDRANAFRSAAQSIRSGLLSSPRVEEETRLRVAAQEVVERRDPRYSPNQLMSAIDRLAAALSPQGG